MKHHATILAVLSVAASASQAQTNILTTNSAISQFVAFGEQAQAQVEAYWPQYVEHRQRAIAGINELYLRYGITPEAVSTNPSANPSALVVLEHRLKAAERDLASLRKQLQSLNPVQLTATPASDTNLVVTTLTNAIQAPPQDITPRPATPAQ